MKRIFSVLNILALLLGHIIMFFIFRYFLSINGHVAQVILTEFLLTAWFITVIAPFLIYYQDNYFNRALYLSANLWIGYMVNSTLVVAGLTLVLFIKYILGIGFTVPFICLQLIVFLGPILLMLSEIYNVLDIRVKEIEVKIKNLPQYWEGKKIVQLSDIHLGPIYRDDFFLKVINKVKKIHPDMVVITGDLFDGMEADFSWLYSLRGDLEFPLGVYFVLGNHELRMGEKKVLDLLKDSAIKTLDNELIEKEGLQIIGLTCVYDRKMDFITTLKNTGYDRNKANILLFHEPRYIDEAQNMGIDLQLSGHTHRGQIFPGNILASIIYRGYLYGLYKMGSYNLNISAGTGTWGPPLRLGHHSEIVLITLKKK